MEQKIYIEGKECGSVNFSRDGIYTTVDAEICSQKKLMRLYIQGSGKTFALGIMEPRGKRSVFKKRYSKIETKNFPPAIERVIAVPFDEKPPEIEKTAKTVNKTKPPKQLPQKKETKGSSENNNWITENGNLFFVAKGSKYLAIPADLRKEVPGIRLKYYKNRQYMLFRY